MKLDYDRDRLLPEFAIKTLQDKYMIPGEKSPQEAFARAAKAFADNDEHAQRLYDYASKLWFMFATPVLANGGTKRGLPVSCYLSYTPDSIEGLSDHYKESAFLSSVGGGIGAYWGDVRSDGSKTSKGSVSSGIIPFLKVADSNIMAFKQGGVRRGSYAYYVPVDHPEIEEVLISRKPTGGDENRKCLNLHQAVNLPDKFMQAVKEGLMWDLIDPNTKKVVKQVPARSLWQLILETRVSSGEPYIHFIDTTNRLKSVHHTRLKLDITCSNLCSEIVEPCNQERTAVCCLSSVNLEKFDEWVNEPLFIRDLVRMLDNVLQFFIDNAPDQLAKARFSASRERSIGLGAMGFHSYLQLKNIPFEGPLASGINRRIFRLIKDQAEAATFELANERGACPDAEGFENRRNIYLIAIAPNASSSIICGNTSPSIEPFRANAYVQKTSTGSSLARNPHLIKLLEEKGFNTQETWSSIIANAGSVQHLECLSDWEKDVFKTAMEIDQRWVIDHAAVRQEYICQSQSVNVFIPSNASILELHEVHMMAWEKGLKTLYYCRSTAPRKSEVIGTKVDRVVRSEFDEESCFSCQG